MMLPKLLHSLVASFAPEEGAYQPSPQPHLQALAEQPTFSSILPYGTYDERANLFGLPTSHGFVLEVMPQTGADIETIKQLKDLYRHCSEHTGVQIHMFGDPNVLPIYRRHANMRPADTTDSVTGESATGRGRNLFRVQVRKQITYLLRGSRQSLWHDMAFLVRDFRCFISVTVPEPLSEERSVEETLLMRDAMRQTLSGAGFISWVWSADDLLNFLFPLVNPTVMFNGRRETNADLQYDDGRALRSQVVLKDTVCRVGKKGLVFGTEPEEVEVRSYSVLGMPKRFPLWSMGALIGDFHQAALQHTCPFLFTLGVSIPDFEKMKAMAQLKSGRAKQNSASPMAKYQPSLLEADEDWSKVMKQIDDGGSMVNLHHQLMLFARPSRMTQAEVAASSVFRAKGFTLSNDHLMQMQAYLNSLPLTLSRDMQHDLKKTERFTQKTTDNAINLAPFLAEWKGLGDPVMVFHGRRGQVVSLDMFANHAGNFNGAVSGVSGSGKTSTMNLFPLSVLAVGGKAWIIDIGGGYEKLCHSVGGTYIRFSRHNPPCMNPFSWINLGSEEEGKNTWEQEMKMLKPMHARMASHSEALDNYELSLLEEAITAVWNKYQHEGEPHLVAHYLMNECKGQDGINVDPVAYRLGKQMYPFTRDGMYGKYVNGPATLDLKGDFVVLELEELNGAQELRSVALFALLYRITFEMYLMPRDRRKMAMMDEAWDLFDSTADTAKVIEEGYRRARKYGGQFVSGTQGIRDYYEKGPAAMAAYDNSDWHFFLRQDPDQVADLERKGKLTLTPAEKRMLLSLQKVDYKFAEVMIKSPYGAHVVRVVLDPFTLLMVSSKGDDVEAIKLKRQMGVDMPTAIELVLADRGLLEANDLQELHERVADMGIVVAGAQRVPAHH